MEFTLFLKRRKMRSEERRHDDESLLFFNIQSLMKIVIV